MFAPDQIPNGFDNTLSGDGLNKVKARLTAFDMVKIELEKSNWTVLESTDSYLRIKSQGFTFMLDSFGNNNWFVMHWLHCLKVDDLDPSKDVNKLLQDFPDKWAHGAVSLDGKYFSVRISLFFETQDFASEVIAEGAQMLVSTLKRFRYGNLKTN